MLGSPSAPTITWVGGSASGPPTSSSTFCRDKCPLKAAWSTATAWHGEKGPLAPLKDNPQTWHLQGQLWGVNSSWEVYRTDPIKCTEVVAASTSLYFTNTAPCSHSHIRFWLSRGLWDALLQSETKPGEPCGDYTECKAFHSPQILLSFNQQREFRTACLCHVVRISSYFWKRNFNVLEETKVRCYIMLFEKAV